MAGVTPKRQTELGALCIFGIQPSNFVTRLILKHGNPRPFFLYFPSFMCFSLLYVLRHDAFIHFVWKYLKWRRLRGFKFMVASIVFVSRVDVAVSILGSCSEVYLLLFSFREVFFLIRR